MEDFSLFLSYLAWFVGGWQCCAGWRFLSDRRRAKRLRDSSVTLLPPALPEAEYKARDK